MQEIVESAVLQGERLKPYGNTGRDGQTRVSLRMGEWLWKGFSAYKGVPVFQQGKEQFGGNEGLELLICCTLYFEEYSFKDLYTIHEKCP